MRVATACLIATRRREWRQYLILNRSGGSAKSITCSDASVPYSSIQRRILRIDRCSTASVVTIEGLGQAVRNRALVDALARRLAEQPEEALLAYFHGNIGGAAHHVLDGGGERRFDLGQWRGRFAHPAGSSIVVRQLPVDIARKRLRDLTVIEEQRPLRVPVENHLQVTATRG